MKKEHKKWIKHIVFFILGLTLFGILIYYTNRKGLSQLKNINYYYLIAAFIVSLGITASIAFRWGTIVNSMNKGKLATWLQYYHYFIQSRALGFILPKDITDLGIRVLWLKKNHKSRLTNAGVSVIIDRLFDLIFMLTFFSAVLSFWFGWINEKLGIIFMIVFILVLGIILFTNFKLFIKIFEKLLNFAFKIFRYIPFIKKKIPDKIEIPHFERKTVIKIYFASLIKVFFTIVRFILFALCFNITIDPLLIVMGTPVAQFSYLFAFTPGGLGIFEAGWLGIFKLAQINTQQALLFVIGQRLLTIIIISSLAIISQIIFSIKKLKK